LPSGPNHLARKRRLIKERLGIEKHVLRRAASTRKPNSKPNSPQLRPIETSNICQPRFQEIKPSDAPNLGQHRAALGKEVVIEKLFEHLE